MEEKYPRYITPGFEPFDPVELARKTEEIVTRHRKGEYERKYTAFYATGVYAEGLIPKQRIRWNSNRIYRRMLPQMSILLG